MVITGFVILYMLAADWVRHKLDAVVDKGVAVKCDGVPWAWAVGVRMGWRGFVGVWGGGGMGDLI